MVRSFLDRNAERVAISISTNSHAYNILIFRYYIRYCNIITIVLYNIRYIYVVVKQYYIIVHHMIIISYCNKYTKTIM